MEQSEGTKLVGVLNITPDSFSDGGKYFDPYDALKQARQLFDEGAAFIDIGAESTRPGAEAIDFEEEKRRLGPVLNEYAALFTEQISLDTYRPETVRWVAANMGPVIVNDVTGFNNPEMVETVAKLQFPAIVSHHPASFGQDIQAAHSAEHKIDSAQQVVDELLERREQMITAGVSAGAIILDPGIGFGKTMRLNWELLKFGRRVDSPVMIGYSNKSFLRSDQQTGTYLPNADSLKDNKPWMRERNLYAGAIAVGAGAAYLRVHDVAAHRELLLA